MKKKSAKKLNLTDNQIGVMIEGMYSQFQAFAEGQNVIIEKIDKLDDRLSRVEDDVIEIKHRLSEKADLRDFQKLEKRMLKLEKLVLAKI